MVANRGIEYARQPPADPGTAGSPAADAAASLADWRRRSTTLLLAVFAALGLPPLLISLTSEGVALPSGLKVFYLVEYAMVWVLLLWRHAEHRLRVALVLLMCYLPAVIGLARVGLAGSGRVYLMALPLLAFILGGSGWGLAGAAISIATGGSFVALAAAGMLGSTLASPGGADDIALWFLRFVVMVMLLVPIVLLLERSHRLQQATLEAERRVSARLREEQERSRGAYQDLVEQRRARRSLEASMLEVVERERRLTGHELHDGVCQQLTAARVRCQLLREAEAGDHAAHLVALEGFVDGALAQAHALAQGLSPGELSIAELPAAVEEYARAAAAALGERVDVRLRVEGELPAVAPEVTSQLFRIAQEAVRNALTHGSPGRIDVALGDAGAPFLVIEDDGRGMTPAASGGNGMGLRIMRYRAESLGGHCDLAAGATGGTRVTVTLPDSGARLEAGERHA